MSAMPTTASPPDAVPIPTLALIAHDGKKTDLLAHAMFNRDRLAVFNLVATESTAQMLEAKVGLSCRAVLPGPHGGDVQIASLVAEGQIAAIIFLVDPLTAHPHDPDVRTLLRICNVHNVPIATNIAAADLFLSSPMLQARAPALLAD